MSKLSLLKIDQASRTANSKRRLEVNGLQWRRRRSSLTKRWRRSTTRSTRESRRRWRRLDRRNQVRWQATTTIEVWVRFLRIVRREMQARINRRNRRRLPRTRSSRRRTCRRKSSRRRRKLSQPFRRLQTRQSLQQPQHKNNHRLPRNRISRSRQSRRSLNDQRKRTMRVMSRAIRRTWSSTRSNSQSIEDCTHNERGKNSRRWLATSGNSWSFLWN